MKKIWIIDFTKRRKEKSEKIDKPEIIVWEETSAMILNSTGGLEGEQHICLEMFSFLGLES